MPDLLTKGDSLSLHLTGTRLGFSAFAPWASLGGARLGLRADSFGALMQGGTIPSIIVEYVSGKNGAGEGMLIATGADDLTWVPPGGAVGADVTILDGESKIIEGADTDQFIIVTRDSDADLTGFMNVTCLVRYANAIGMGNVSEPDSIENRYRGLMYFNGSGADCTSSKVKINVLGSPVISDVDQLHLVFSGKIETTGSFEDWLKSGWARIETSGGSLRENIYYSSRTDTILTIDDTFGRAVLGTSRASGASDDVVYPIPGIRIGLEAPVDGEIQTIGSETTEPSGITWSTEITYAAGLTIPTLADGEEYGLWIHNELPPPGDITGNPRLENSIGTQWDNAAVTYEKLSKGYYAVDQWALEEFQVFVGEDAPPDTDATPDASGGSFPLVVPVTPPVSGEKVLNVLVLGQNAWDLTSRNKRVHTLVIDDAGEDATSPLTVPEGITARVVPGGYVDVAAEYSPSQDASPADKWNLYIRTDGTDPVPSSDTPTQIDMGTGRTFTPNYYLADRLGPYPYNTDFRMIARTLRISDGAESTNTDVTQVTVDTYEPLPIANRRGFIGDAAAQQQDARNISQTEIIDIPTNTRIIATNGKTLFYTGSTLIFGMVASSDDPDNSSRFYLPRDNFEFEEVAVSGAGGSLPIEVIDANTLYIVVNGIRRVKIDVAAGRLQAPAFVYRSSMPDSLFDGPLWQRGDMVAFQVWDVLTETWIVVVTVESDGTFTTSSFVDATKLQTEI